MKIKQIAMSALLVVPLFVMDSCNEEVTTDEKIVSEENVFATDATIRLLSGPGSGLALSKFPQVKRISGSSLKSIGTKPETGVFVVDSDYLPVSFIEDLKSEGLTLDANGTLTNKQGKKEVLFVYSRMYEVTPTVSHNGRTAASPSSAFVGGISYYINDYDDWSWTCPREKGYRAKTTANAYKPEKVNGEWVPLKIDLIKTEVTIGLTDTTPDRTDQCNECNTLSSSTKWDIGCFGGALPIKHGRHYAHFKNGSHTLTFKDKISDP